MSHIYIHIYALPSHMQSLPMINIPDQNSTFFLPDHEPLLTYHNHPKSIIYLKVHSVLYILQVRKKMYNDIYSLLYHTKFFFLCVLFINLFPLLFNSCNHYSFYCPHKFNFSRNMYN